jgi:hypothetical protein
MPIEKKQEELPQTLVRSFGASFSWWSWRPGLKPRNALALGGILGCIGLLLTSLGLFLLFFGTWDRYSPLQAQAAIIVQHQPGNLPSLTIQTSKPDPTGTISLLVSEQAYKQLTNGTKVQVLYSQHLQVPQAIKAAGQSYALSEGSSLEEPVNALVLLLLGLVLFCYPTMLARWGWRDLFIEQMMPEYRSTIMGRVVGKRTLESAQSSRPGRIRVGKGFRWYGIALQAAPGNKKQDIATFSGNEEHFSRAQEGEWVLVQYSPHLHYVYDCTSQDTSLS